LLLAFQVLCGSVYHQVGVIVTVFMVGLALGAMLTNRTSRREEAHFESAIGNRQSTMKKSLLTSAATIHGVITPQHRVRGPGLQGLVGRVPPRGVTSDAVYSSKDFGRRSLAILALAIALFAALLPFLLPLLNRIGATPESLFVVKTAIVVLTLLLAALVGIQFPLANQLQFDGAVGGASRLYTADYVGACLGALLASTLLIPLVGVTGVCLVTAGLNVLGSAAACHQRKSIAAV
jgi:spermidine synthase